MKRHCAVCGREFVSDKPNKLFCSEACKKTARYIRDEGFYEYEPEFDEPLYEFNCLNCGRHVEIRNRHDQRVYYCCGKCAYEYRNKRDTYNARLRRAQRREADEKAKEMSALQ